MQIKAYYQYEPVSVYFERPSKCRIAFQNDQSNSNFFSQFMLRQIKDVLLELGYICFALKSICLLSVWQGLLPLNDDKNELRSRNDIDDAYYKKLITESNFFLAVKV